MKGNLWFINKLVLNKHICLPRIFHFHICSHLFNLFRIDLKTDLKIQLLLGCFLKRFNGSDLKISTLVFSNSVGSNMILLSQKLWSHSWYVFFFQTPHLILQEILLALYSESDSHSPPPWSLLLFFWGDYSRVLTGLPAFTLAACPSLLKTEDKMTWLLWWVM